MTETEVDYELSGTINNTDFQIEGSGVGSVDTGELDMELEVSSLPDGWAPETFNTICCHATTAYFCKGQNETPDFAELVDQEYAVSPARTATIVDSDGQRLAKFEATSQVYFEGDRLVSKNELDGEANLPAISSVVTPIEDVILPTGPGRCTALSTYTMETADDKRLRGITTVPYELDTDARLDGPIHRRISRVDTDLDGHELTAGFAAEMEMADFAVDSTAVSTALSAQPTPSDD